MAGISIVIHFDPEKNKVNVRGPVQNPVVFLGMLEFAKAVALSAARQPAEEPEKLVQPVTAIPNLGGK